MYHTIFKPSQPLANIINKEKPLKRPIKFPERQLRQPLKLHNKQIEKVIKDILQYVNRDFVSSWYSPISDNEDFLNQIDYTLEYAVNELVQRIQNVDFGQLILGKLMNMITAHVREIQNAEKLVRASRLNIQDKEFYKLVASHYGQGKLHPAVIGNLGDTTEQEHQYLRKKIKNLLPLLLPPKEAANSLVLVLVRELVCTVLLRPLINSFAQSDYWNLTFDLIGGYLMEQHEHPKALRKPSEYFDDLKDEVPTFDRFLKQISTCETLEDALRLRSTILDEIQQKQSLIQGCSDEDVINGTKVAKYHNYIHRLQIALTRNDKMITKLSKKEMKTEKVSFGQVLDDPSLTCYFEEFLEQNGKTHLLAYWTSATAFQDQLCIEKPILSIDEQFDNTMVETWEWGSIAIVIRDLWIEFFEPSASLLIVKYVRPDIVPRLQEYVDSIDRQQSEKMKVSLGITAVCCILVALQDIAKCLKDDFYPFLKSPLGEKMIQKHFGVFQPFTKLLKSRSPEREMRSPERNSMDSDRGDDPVLERRKSVLDGLKRTSKSILGRISGEEQRDEIARMAPRMETVDDHEQELMDALDDQAYEVKGKKKGKMEEKLLGLIKKRPKSGDPPSSPTIDRRTKSIDFQTQKPYLKPSSKPPLDIQEDKQDTEAESFMKLEMEDNTPSPVDDELGQQGQVPPMIILPKAFFELDEKLTVLQRDFNQIEKDLKRNPNDEPLVKSLQYAKRGVWHEIQDVTAEKQKMEQNEIENIIIAKKCSVSIGPSHVLENEGRDYAVYPIQVSRLNSEGVTSGWIVLRRYSQFLTLHQALKQKFPSIMNGLELPGKLMGLIKRRTTVLESRRVALQGYLNALLDYPQVCQFEIFRRFLCHPAIIKLLYGDNKESPQKKSFIRNVFSTVDGQLDSIFHHKKSAIEQPKSIVFAHSPNEEDLETNVSSTTEPLIDLFIELFELKGLRKQAVVLFLQQLFGDTVERRVNESLKDALCEERVFVTLQNIRDAYWPNGVYTTNIKERTVEEKQKTKFEANRKVMMVVPDLVGGLVGRQNARRGAIRLCTLFNNERLNKHLFYKILDEVFGAIFLKS